MGPAMRWPDVVSCPTGRLAGRPAGHLCQRFAPLADHVGPFLLVCLSAGLQFECLGCSRLFRPVQIWGPNGLLATAAVVCLSAGLEFERFGCNRLFRLVQTWGPNGLRATAAVDLPLAALRGQLGQTKCKLLACSSKVHDLLAS